MIIIKCILIIVMIFMFLTIAICDYLLDKLLCIHRNHTWVTTSI